MALQKKKKENKNERERQLKDRGIQKCHRMNTTVLV